jgi:antitoxin VapB
MAVARIFQHGGSQAVRLPKEFRFEGTAVLIEKRGEEVILKPLRHQALRTFPEIARYLSEKFSGNEDFPESPPRPKHHERPIAEF